MKLLMSSSCYQSFVVDADFKSNTSYMTWTALLTSELNDEIMKGLIMPVTARRLLLCQRNPNLNQWPKLITERLSCLQHRLFRILSFILCKNVYNATFTDAETHRNANCSLLPCLSVQNIMATCLTGMLQISCISHLLLSSWFQSSFQIKRGDKHFGKRAVTNFQVCTSK